MRSVATASLCAFTLMSRPLNTLSFGKSRRGTCEPFLPA